VTRTTGDRNNEPHNRTESHHGDEVVFGHNNTIHQSTVFFYLEGLLSLEVHVEQLPCRGTCPCLEGQEGAEAVVIPLIALAFRCIAINGSARRTAVRKLLPMVFLLLDNKNRNIRNSISSTVPDFRGHEEQP